MKLNKAISIAVIAVVIIAIAIVAAVIFPRTNLAVLISSHNAVTNMGEEMSMRLAHSPFNAFALMNEAYQEGTGTITLDFNFRTISPWDPNVDGVITIASNIEDNAHMLSGEVRVMGLPIDLEMHLNSERLAMQSRIIDRNNFYGITFATFARDIVYFGNMLGWGSIETGFLTDIVLNIEEVMNTDLQEENNRVYIDLFAEFFADIEYTSENMNKHHHGEELQVRRVEYVVSVESIMMFIDDLLALVQNDERLVDNFADVLEFYNERFDGEISLALYIGDRNRLVYATLDIDIESADIQIYGAIDFGLADTDTWRLVASIILPEGETEEIEILWHFNEADDGYKNIFEATYNNETINLTSVWNPVDGRFYISFDDGRNYISFSGEFFTADNGGFRLQLDNIEIPDMGNLLLVVGFSPSAEIPDIEFINIDQWDTSLIDMFNNSVFGTLF